MSKINNELNTTKDLRKFLTSAMVDVRTSLLDIDKANSIYKLDGQVNASIYGELKANILLDKMGKDTKHLGDMVI